MKPIHLLLRAGAGWLALLVALLSGLPGAAYAHPAPTVAPTVAAAPGLGTLLNPDGSLNLTSGFQGSLDPTGYTMQMGPNGAPRFVPAASPATGPGGEKAGPAGTPMTVPGDDDWDARFAYAAPDGAVRALAVYDGDLVIGGDFTAVGTITANGIARWSHGQWLALGNGFNGSVRALAAWGGTLYAGGTFTASADGSLTLRRIARWSGLAWSEPGGGMNGFVYALVTDPIYNRVYAGGTFTTAGGSTASHVAYWTGSQWSALLDNDTHVEGTSGASGGEVYALAVDDVGRIYVGGDFVYAGGQHMDNLAVWRAGNWDPVGGGMNTTVLALAVDSDNIYVGGTFSDYGYSGQGFNHIARWNKTTATWSPLGGGLADDVNAIAVVDGELYAGGDFLANRDNEPQYYLAHYTGGNFGDWEPVGYYATLNAPVRALLSLNANLYIGGAFTDIGFAVGQKYIARWDPDAANWPSVSGGPNGSVYALAISGSNVYIGGNFTEIGGQPMNRVAYWDGARWQSLGTGFNGPMRALAFMHGDLYAGGDFTLSGFTHLRYLARWTGASWTDVGQGVGGPVYALASTGSTLYVGGDFIVAGASPANRVARWGGSQWSALGNGTNGVVRTLAVSGSDVYVGGDFQTVGYPSVASPGAARWDGSQWRSMNGTGMNAPVRALAVVNGTVYAGGDFTAAGSSIAHYLARWTGTDWTPLGPGTGGIDGPVYALAVRDSQLYVGGKFTQVAGLTARRVVHWTGSDWTTFGSGLQAAGLLGDNCTTHALAIAGSDLYAGGNCNRAGGKYSVFFALHHNTP
jgi:hypothetical protein